MRRAGWVAMTVFLPMLYAAAVYVATRRPKPVYAFADPTVLTVTEQPGPAVLHAPEPIYPAEALRKRIEGGVKFKVTVAADGTVAHAVLVSGPAPLVDSALTTVRQYQFEAKAGETDIEVPFSSRTAVRSFVGPVALQPVLVKRAQGRERGVVRVVVTVDQEGVVQAAQVVTGHPRLSPVVRDAAMKWKFRPALRNGTAVGSSAVIDVPVL
jgi:TonB family protein